VVAELNFRTSSDFKCISFHSLEGNKIGDSGASALADALRVNQSLTMLRYLCKCMARVF